VGRRWSVRAAWPLAGCAVLGLLAGLLETVVVHDPHAPHGQVMLGMALSLMHVATHLHQAAVPLLAGAAFVLPRRSVAA
jgi:hypothetical protein